MTTLILCVSLATFSGRRCRRVLVELDVTRECNWAEGGEGMCRRVVIMTSEMKWV